MRSLVIGSGSWAGIYENGVEVAATCCRSPSEIISPHAPGDRYRIEITNSILRYIRYRAAGGREIMFSSASPLPAYPISLGLGISPQNAEWQKTVLAQLTRKATWSSMINGISLGNGSVRNTSTGAGSFSANAAQTLLRGDGYFESTASMYSQSINLSGSDGMSRSFLIGTGGWAAIYENGQMVANTSPLLNITPHAAGDRYRLEIANGVLKYVRYRSGVRAIMYTSTNPIQAYPLGFSLTASAQNAEWQNTVIAQLSQTVSWSSITNGIDLGNGSVRKTSTGAWDFGAWSRQQLVDGSGYFESTASGFNESISLGGADGQARSLIAGTGGWFAAHENGQEVANTSPLQNITPHGAGDRYRLEISRGKLRYVRYRASVRTKIFTSNNFLPSYPFGFFLGASFQNTEWQNTIFSDNVPEHNAASFVSQTVPATMVPGQTYSVSVTMRNTGASTWTPEGDYQLASDNLPDNQTWGLSRVNLTTIVMPGSDGTFNFTVTAPPNGSHSFQWRMVGVERFGALTPNVNVQTVTAPPTVLLTSPSNNQIFIAGSTIPLAATAADSDGTISKVEFFRGAVKLGEDTTAPYTYSWTSVLAGNYVLTARATDNGSATATSTATNITVNAPNQPPVAQHGGPYSGTTGTAVQFNAAGSSDPDGTITIYHWNFGDSTSGTGVSPTHIYTTAGTRTVTLTVTDNSGAQGSANTTATIANRPPVANAGGPYSGVTETAIQFNAGGSSDPDGTITSYQWNFGDSTTGTGVAPTHIYTLAGTHPVTLVVTDNSGATASSLAPVNVTVANTNVSPSVSISSPTHGAVVTAGANVAIAASASDTDGTISKVEFFQGSTKLGEDLTTPYNFTWTNPPIGTHSLTARATDNLGATTSTSVNLTVSGNSSPSVSILHPSNDATLSVPATVLILAGASDVDGSISKVEFFQGNTKLGETLTSPYQFIWYSAPVGTYSLTVRATDNLGATKTSSAISLVITTPPVARPGGPYTGTLGQAVPFDGSGSSDSDGTIASYLWDFGDGDGLGSPGSGSNPTHVYSTAGTYTVALLVTDNRGVASNAITNITINPPGNQPPQASPGGPYTGTSGQIVQFNGSGSTDVDGTIASYLWNFGDGTTSTGANATHLYAAGGTYIVSLTVTDNEGALASTPTIATINQAAAVPIPRDGFPSLTYDANNRITTGGFAYDAAGNLILAPDAGGYPQYYEYDAANRLVKVRDLYGSVIASYTYGPGNQRLIAQNGDNSNVRTYYIWSAGTVIAEYSENASAPISPRWAKSYVYLEGRLLATHEANGTGEMVEYHHPDRLGTRIVTRSDGTWYEQVTLPFGVPLNSESTGASNQRFTSYDRSAITGLDYAVNRSTTRCRGGSPRWTRPKWMRQV